MRVLGGIRASDAILTLLVAAGVVFVALLNSRPQQGATDTFASTDYRSGGYAAWFTLLQREGVATERFERRPAELDAHIDTLIAAAPVVPAGADARRPPDLAALARWVREGGRLITLANDRPFGPSAPHFVAARTPYGRGVVVSVLDPRQFDNGLLARDDNARRAFLLARPRQPGGVVAFDEALHGTIVDRSWWRTLDVPQRVALGGIALAVLIALAGSALRLGPAVSLQPAREPASDEFIAAVAGLYQRNRARRAALALLAAGVHDAGGEAVMQLRALAERQSPDDRDLVAGAVLARAIRMAR